MKQVHAWLNTTSISLFQDSEINLVEAQSKMNVAFIGIDLKMYALKLASLSNISSLGGFYLL